MRAAVHDAAQIVTQCGSCILPTFESRFQVLSDFGGVYISSDDNLCFEKSPERCYLPTRVHGNVIAGCDYYNYGCNGVYMDEQVIAGAAMTGRGGHGGHRRGGHRHSGRALRSGSAALPERC